MEKLTLAKNITLITREVEYNKEMGMLVITKLKKNEITAGTDITIEKRTYCLNNYVIWERFSDLDFPAFTVSILNKEGDKIETFNSIPYMFCEHRDFAMGKLEKDIIEGSVETHII